ncbi:MAG: 50S ribosomal protein L11 methyltransferase [Firmicutes bacterium]|nr:50S ribosomal protein L11 methyltransferase [Bacillota bacterium]
MDWLKVEVTVSLEAAEALSSAMLNLSPSGIQIDNKDDAVTLTAYVPESYPVEDIQITLKAALEKIDLEGLKTDPATISISTISDEDWAENYKKSFKPVRIGRFLIRPSWQEVESFPNEIVIQLDPGLAFGTGSHPTTEGCLIFLQEFVRGTDTVLDLGTGSGILAIAAAKLGAKKVVAIDNDPQAIEVAKENAAENGVADKIDFIVKDFSDLELTQVDLLVANLTASMIINFLPDIVRRLKGLKIFIASGITVEQKGGILEALKDNGFIVKKILDIGEWTNVVSELG